MLRFYLYVRSYVQVSPSYWLPKYDHRCIIVTAAGGVIFHRTCGMQLSSLFHVGWIFSLLPFVHIFGILNGARGFPDSSVGKEYSYNAGDPGSIPGLGRYAGEGIGCPPQYSWAPLVAQLVKNPSAMQETWVLSWVGKMPWRKERLPTPAFWPAEFQGLCSPWVCKKSDTTELL